ncbi:MAG: DUF1232 domain-containing protein [Lentisphaeria bacterium]|nr:DUF1232 domain-containing protein [Lentisphaeria bacterium]
MSVKRLIGKASDALFSPVENSKGVTSFKSVKFYIVLVLYSVSTIFFVRDPFFQDRLGEFHLIQSSVILFSALVVMASLHWELLLFGRPSGANLVLQLTSLIPFMLFYARITGKSTIDATEEGSLLGKAFDWAQQGMAKLSGFSTPAWVTDILQNWQCTLLLVLFLLVLSVRYTKVKTGAVILLLVIPFFNTLTTGTERWYLAGAALSLFAGLALQFNHYARHIYFINIINALKERKEMDESFVRCVMRIMKKADEEGQIQENEVLDIVKNEYSSYPVAPGDIRLISGEIVRNMMNEFNLITIRLTGSGMMAEANSRLYNGDNMLTYVAILPRIVVLLLITVVFIISPLDVIPDALPFVGVLDDMALTVFSFMATKNALEAKHEK